MEDIVSMPLGQVVDFCIDYNERQKQARAEEEEEAKKKEKPVTKYRLATQEEIDAYFR
jgi:hypothetical protein